MSPSPRASSLSCHGRYGSEDSCKHTVPPGFGVGGAPACCWTKFKQHGIDRPHPALCLRRNPGEEILEEWASVSCAAEQPPKNLPVVLFVAHDAGESNSFLPVATALVRQSPPSPFSPPRSLPLPPPCLIPIRQLVGLDHVSHIGQARFQSDISSRCSGTPSSRRCPGRRKCCGAVSWMIRDHFWL